MVHARGTISIGGQSFEWIGARITPNDKKDASRAIVYNAACCHVERRDIPELGTRPRMVDPNRNMTPLDAARTDIIVRQDGNALRVHTIREGGGSDLFSGAFIINAPPSLLSSVSVGQDVQPLTIDGMTVRDMQSAVTIGPSLEECADGDLALLDINNDPSLGNQPYDNMRTARSIIYRTADGSTHLRLFDGLRESKKFKGITPQETYQIVSSEHHNDLTWAYHLDGSQSARMLLRENGTYEPYGNLHYQRWPWRGLEDAERYFLDPLRGRRMPSVLCLIHNH